MKVLVSAASKHGATAEIARRIGDVLSSAGVEADVRQPEEVASVSAYDAVVLGSGVYAGRWLGAAKRLVERESGALGSRPVWLFSSGPLGDPAKPEGDPEDVALLMKQTGAVDHRVFSGKVDRRELGIAEKAILAVVHAPEGDYRPWSAVDEWAAGIARAVSAKVAHEAAP
jgi:menaquinone-dependent protoporphyrinogen oxidase